MSDTKHYIQFCYGKTQDSTLTKMEIQKNWIAEEPNACEKRGCTELNNGLWNYWIDFENGFIMETWLCDKHSKEFDRKIMTTDGWNLVL